MFIAPHRKGWSVPHWLVEHGGTGWSRCNAISSISNVAAPARPTTMRPARNSLPNVEVLSYRLDCAQLRRRVRYADICDDRNPIKPRHDFAQETHSGHGSSRWSPDHGPPRTTPSKRSQKKAHRPVRGGSAHGPGSSRWSNGHGPPPPPQRDRMAPERRGPVRWLCKASRKLFHSGTLETVSTFYWAAGFLKALGGRHAGFVHLSEDQPPSSHAGPYGREKPSLGVEKDAPSSMSPLRRAAQGFRARCFPRIRPAGPTRSDGARQAACCFYVVLTNSAYCAGWLAPGVCPR